MCSIRSFHFFSNQTGHCLFLTLKERSEYNYKWSTFDVLFLEQAARIDRAKLSYGCILTASTGWAEGSNYQERVRFAYVFQWFCYVSIIHSFSFCFFIICVCWMFLNACACAHVAELLCLDRRNHDWLNLWAARWIYELHTISLSLSLHTYKHKSNLASSAKYITFLGNSTVLIKITIAM